LKENLPAHHYPQRARNLGLRQMPKEAEKAQEPRLGAGRTGALTATAMNRVDPWRMIQRRAAELGTRARIGCHTCRATGITAYHAQVETSPAELAHLCDGLSLRRFRAFALSGGFGEAIGAVAGHSPLGRAPFFSLVL
jgi:hypothetical protein